MAKDAFRCITALLLLCWSNGFLCAQENVTRSGSLNSSARRSANDLPASLDRGLGPSAQDDAIEELFPPLLFLPNEEGKPSVALAPTLKSEELNRLLQRTGQEENPKYLIHAMRLDVTAERDFAVVQCQVDVSLLQDGLTAIPIRMGKTHLTKSPTARTSNPTADQDTSVVGMRLHQHDPALGEGERNFAQAGGRDEWELLVRGNEDDRLTIDFESQVHVHRLGKESHLRLELPRVKSEMRVRVPLANATGHLLAAGVLSRAIPIAPVKRSEGSDKGRCGRD